MPHAQIHGSDSGNGENLAHFILKHYNNDNEDQSLQQSHTISAGKLPLLFLAGEQRRDIIPKTLMSDSLPTSERIPVHELAVYETTVMDSFERDFCRVVDAGRLYLDLDKKNTNAAMWVVVFSPTGCDAMLRVLGYDKHNPNPNADSDSNSKGHESGCLLDTTITQASPSHPIFTSQEHEEGKKSRRVFIATIGPTTRDHLRSKYGVEVDVCAEKPSPEGVGKGIEDFMALRSSTKGQGMTL